MPILLIILFLEISFYDDGFLKMERVMRIGKIKNIKRVWRGDASVLVILERCGQIIAPAERYEKKVYISNKFF